MAKVNIDLLNSFQTPAATYAEATVEYFAAIQAAAEAAGENEMRTKLEEEFSIVEKAYNNGMVPALNTCLDNLLTSAENAEEFKQAMKKMVGIDVSGAKKAGVEKTVKKASFAVG